MIYFIKIFEFLLRLFPIDWIVKLTYGILKKIRYREQVINKNLDHVYANEKIQIAYKKEFFDQNIKHISRVIGEILFFDDKKHGDLINFGPDETLKNIMDHGQCIVLAAHYGNWELACTVLAKNLNLPCYGVYKPIKNKAIDTWIQSKRAQLGLELISVDELPRFLTNRQAQDKKGVYILISDQNPRSINKAISTQFLGVETLFFNGAQRLSSKFDLPVYYMSVNPQKQLFSYSILMHRITQENIIPTYARLLDRQIRAEPYAWLWSHKRWKRFIDYKSD